MTQDKKSFRQDRIAQLVMDRGSMSVDALADRLDVSTQTIRRDIDGLTEDSRFRRVHGRLELAAPHLNTPFDQRAGTNPDAKRAIAARAADLVPDGATLFISIGSTPLAVAHALAARRELTVITNNLSAAMALSAERSNRIILPGGELRLPDRDMVGDEAITFLERYRAEFCIFGVAGIDADGSLLEFQAAEIRTCEKMRANARTAILVTDRTKFGRMAPAAAGNITTLDHVILDRAPEAPFDTLLDDMQGTLVLAEGETA